MLVYSDLEAGARDPTRVAESPKAVYRLGNYINTTLYKTYNKTIDPTKYN